MLYIQNFVKGDIYRQNKNLNQEINYNCSYLFYCIFIFEYLNKIDDKIKVYLIFLFNEDREVLLSFKVIILFFFIYKRILFYCFGNYIENNFIFLNEMKYSLIFNLLYDKIRIVEDFSCY